jgi:hypothetical protein
MPHPAGTLTLSRKTSWLLAFLALVVLLAGPAFMAYRWAKPADRVLVTVANIDPSTRFFCLLVDTPAGPKAMWWSLDYVGPFTMHPGNCIVSDFDPPWDRPAARRQVSWQDGARYGVLTRDRGDHWQVFWFTPEEVNLRGRSWLLGGGEASIDLPAKDRGEPASDEFLDRVGIRAEDRKRMRESGDDP